MQDKLRPAKRLDIAATFVLPESIITLCKCKGIVFDYAV
jgi:hypothetical protein